MKMTSIGTCAIVIYPDCLLVGKSWSEEGEMALLNSRIVFPNGEWEGIFFAD